MKTNKRKSRVLWLGKEFLTQEQISEVKDRFGNLEIQSIILKNDVSTSEDLAKVFEEIRNYNIIIVQKTSFKKNLLIQLLDYNKEKIRKVFCAFCQLKRRSTRKELVIISNAEKADHYGQIEL